MFDKLFETYLGRLGNLESNGFRSCRCPWNENHDEGKRSSKAGVNPLTGYFNCFKCGALSLRDFLEKLGHTPEEVYAIIDDFLRRENKIEHQDTFVDYRIRNPRFEELARKARSQLDPDMPMVKNYMLSRALRIETLQDLGVGYLSEEDTHWGRDSLVFPYEVDGYVVGLRYRDTMGSKGGELGCHFCLWGLDQLDDKSINAAVIVEGESDRLATYQAIREFNIENVAVLSTPTAAFKAEWAREVKGLRKYIQIPHCDEASSKMIRGCQDALGAKLVTQRLVWQKKQLGNDICDWLRYNPPHKLADIIREALGDVDRVILSGKEFLEVAERPRSWVISNLIGRREVAVIGGKPKSMKTWTMLNLVRTLLLPGSSFCNISSIRNVADRPQRILVIEEEGNIEEMFARAKLTLNGTTWVDNTFWSHQLRWQFDDYDSVDRLSDFIGEHDIDFVFGDPFQRLYSVDENSSTEMGTVFRNIHNLLYRHTKLSAVFLHHFNKTSSIDQKWDAFRGSSRIPGEVDLGVFQERNQPTDPAGIRMIVDGRSLVQGAVTSLSGTDVHKLRFDNGIFTEHA